MPAPSYKLRAAVPEDFDFVKRVHHETLRPHVEKIWGWNDSDQDQMVRSWFDKSPLQLIEWESRSAGVLSLEERESEIFIQSILISPEVQKQGLGTAVIRGLQDRAAASGRGVALGVFKINPARELYERLGFHTLSESETHYQMRWSLKQFSPPPRT